MGAKGRVLYVLKEYPQISQTYIKAEIEAVREEFDLRVVSLQPAPMPYDDHVDFEVRPTLDELCVAIEEFKPDVLHMHWLTASGTLAALARRTGVPFTLRSHSFDTLWAGWRGAAYDRMPGGLRVLRPPHLRDVGAIARDDLCLGILGFPFVRRRLEKAGVPSHKFFDSWPVVDVQRFHDRSPNGDRIMNTGAALGKKKMDDFLSLATALPGRAFDLYPLSFKTAEVTARNAEMGSPVTVMPPVQPNDMPREFKRHEWLLYLGDTRVGWPVSIAEAQASGVGVCVQAIRPAMNEYVGPAGFVFESTSELAAILSKPYPEEMRQQGFEHARHSDIHAHKHVLTDLWEAAIPRSSEELAS